MPSFGDFNRINTNIQSLDSQLSLNRINSQIADNQLKMSTGKRINRAEDDSAGYSIATKLKGRIGGLNQAMQNVGDAKSVLDIAESSYNTVMDSLVEMKGLATQAANDSLGEDERAFIGEQIKQLGEDINKVADQTVYQDYDLLDGTASGEKEGDAVKTGSQTLTFQVGERESDTIDAKLNAINVAELFSGDDAAIDDKDLGVAAGSGGAATASFSSSAIRLEGAATGAGNAVAGELHFTAETGGTTVNANSEDYRSFLNDVDGAITKMSENVNQIGITQSSLSVREETLSQSISANESAKSRIMDTDFAKAQSESVRLQILQQTATSSLAQANNGPQSVLGFIGG